MRIADKRRREDGWRGILCRVVPESVGRSHCCLVYWGSRDCVRSLTDVAEIAVQVHVTVCLPSSMV